MKQIKVFENKTLKFQNVLSEINISTQEKYIITDSKIRNGNMFVLITIFVGGLEFLVGIGVYIGLKKQYWFW